MWNLTQGQWLCLVFSRPKDSQGASRWGATFLWGLIGFAAVAVLGCVIASGRAYRLYYWVPNAVCSAVIIVLFLDVVAGINFIAALGGPVSNTFISTACLMPILLWGVTYTTLADTMLSVGICLVYLAAGIAAGYGGARLRKLWERRHQRMHSDRSEQEDREI